MVGEGDFDSIFKSLPVTLHHLYLIKVQALHNFWYLCMFLISSSTILPFLSIQGLLRGLWRWHFCCFTLFLLLRILLYLVNNLPFKTSPKYQLWILYRHFIRFSWLIQLYIVRYTVSICQLVVNDLFVFLCPQDFCAS